MNAKELALRLLEHPEYLVKVGVMQHLFGDPCYGYDNIENNMIEVDESNQIIYLGE